MAHPLARRTLVAAVALGAVWLTGAAQAQDKKLKVAAVYTVPFEQQWVGRIHKALKAAEARGEIEYGDRERRQRRLRAGDARVRRGRQPADRRRGVRRSRPRAQGRQGLSQDRLPDGLTRQAAGAQLRVFDNYIQEPAYLTGMVAGAHDQVATRSAWSAASRSPRSTG